MYCRCIMSASAAHVPTPADEIRRMFLCTSRDVHVEVAHYVKAFAWPSTMADIINR